MSLMTESRAADALEVSEPYDVCIIGSGFAGSVLGTELVKHGVRTIMLESGASLVRWFMDSRIKALADYEVSGDTNYLRTKTKARAIGGNSNFWTGRTERLRPSDFATNPYTPQGAAWPVTYQDMDAYYTRAEKTLRVRGEPLSDYYPPRLTNGPLRPGKDIISLKRTMQEIGVTLDNSPTATPDKGWRTFRVTTELIPKFKASKYAALQSGLTVTRLIPNAERRIVSAEARTLSGEVKHIQARLFVVACGGIESPRLLLLSRSETFPKGIGNLYSRVGRGFNEHPGINLYGRMRHRLNTIVPSYMLGRTNQFYDDFRSEGLGSVLPVIIRSWIFPNHLISVKPSQLPQAAWVILRRLGKPEMYIGATLEMEPDDENRVTLSENTRDRFGNPIARLIFNFTERDLQTMQRTRQLLGGMFQRLGAEQVREGEVTWSRHHISTCSMGDDPKTSVVDRNLRVHETPNLFVAGSETFVTGGAVPPVLTITALSHRLADHLVSRLQDG